MLGVPHLGDTLVGRIRTGDMEVVDRMERDTLDGTLDVALGTVDCDFLTGKHPCLVKK